MFGALNANCEFMLVFVSLFVLYLSALKIAQR